MSVLSEILGLPPLQRLSQKKWQAWHTAYAGDYDQEDVRMLTAALRCPDVPVGIEVEVENTGGVHHTDTTLWMTKPDNSLRQNGIEFVSWPLVGEQIVYALLQLERVLAGPVTFSQRTSVHVHLNVRDLEPVEIAKILLVYLTVEQLLYKFAGHNRDKNVFCVPLNDMAFTRNLYKNLKDLGQRPLIQTEDSRYSGLNFDPLQKFGTIEFRQLHGTKSAIRLLTWVNIIFAIRQYAKGNDLEALITEILALNTNSLYKNYAHKIFGSLMPAFPDAGFDAAIEAGVLAVKRSLFSDKFLKELDNALSPTSPAAVVVSQLWKRPARTPLEIRIADIQAEGLARVGMRPNPFLVQEAREAIVPPPIQPVRRR